MISTSGDVKSTGQAQVFARYKPKPLKAAFILPNKKPRSLRNGAVLLWILFN
jgi:hypothetical protein